MNVYNKNTVQTKAVCTSVKFSLLLLTNGLHGSIQEPEQCIVWIPQFLAKECFSMEAYWAVTTCHCREPS